MNMITTFNFIQTFVDLYKMWRKENRCCVERDVKNDISQEETYVMKEDIRTEHPTVLTECPSLTACCFKRIEK